jgi:hypothetical protein
VGGVAVFFGLNTLMKMPFSTDFLNSGEMSALLIRMVRYTLVVFAVLGAYPMVFKYGDKLFEKEKAAGAKEVTQSENNTDTPEQSPDGRGDAK